MAVSYTVGQINNYIKNMFREDFVLNKITVNGEISNCKYHTSGHVYFTLKDNTGTLSCVMFATVAKNIKLNLKNGIKVNVSGKIDVYERDGKYQLYVNDIKADGTGDLYLKFEELKQTLEEMGMFSKEYKKPIPSYAKKVGIVTAATGAAVQDIINIAKRRNPYVQLYLYPAIVQGEYAKDSIVRGIEKLDLMGLDIIIVGRGGGSIEDLWAFNEECVARAIFDASTPIISAVGHETDFTIADFVSDLRAPTPSAAAELAVPLIENITGIIDNYNVLLNNAFLDKINQYKNLLENYKLQLRYLNPKNLLDTNRQRTIDYEEALDRAIKSILINYRNQLSNLSNRLDGNSPLKTLKSGYSFVENEKGKPVKSITEVKSEDLLKLYVKDGIINARVSDCVKNKWG